MNKPNQPPKLQENEWQFIQCHRRRNITVQNTTKWYSQISTQNPNTYRKLIRHLNRENIIHHTYQMKQDRAFRIVIRDLH